MLRYGRLHRQVVCYSVRQDQDYVPARPRRWGQEEGASPLKGMYNLLKRNPNLWPSANVTMTRLIPHGALTYSLSEAFWVVAGRSTYSNGSVLLSNFITGWTAEALGTLVVYQLDLILD